ncbi:DUF805 domain-containing protein [Acinetobacter puyangensis]|uniref:DUF805 domain-containing protein n=1 Tax=Acinetobacter puyangensis TaxID=1096779 RepID=UPI003A4D7198
MQTTTQVTPPFQDIIDKPLSPQGRFNRLSYLGWTFLFSIVVSAIMVAFSLITGGGIALFLSATNNTNVMESAGFASFGIFYIGLIIIGLLSVYFAFVFAIRRLHDLNITGWISLLLLIPVVNVILYLFLIFAPGTKAPNRFGPIRPSKSWEVALGWIYVAFIILGILFYGAIFGVLMNQFDPATIPAPETLNTV